MPKAPFILLVNPWITDFAAFDLWAKPLGLLMLASLLRDGGCGVDLIDCLDRHDARTNAHPDVSPASCGKYGTGKFPKMVIPKPQVYAEVPRRYHRYGIHPASFQERLQDISKPDLIWVTSIMTYWYPGVVQTIALLRETFPETPIWLGGIYAQLCPGHARAKSGAKEVITFPSALLPQKIEAATGFAVRNQAAWGSIDSLPPPALELITKPTYAPILTSKGCPFRCPYCASRALQPVWERRNANSIYNEIIRWHEEFGIVDFAFYDDALLIQAEESLKPALKRIGKEGLGLRFHTPNALHIRALSPEWCSLLHSSGFTTIRLGLETTRADRQREWGGKVRMEMFFSAVNHLLRAGFSTDQLGAYLLCGLPEQTPEEVAEAIRVVQKAGIQPHLAEYSPIPGTPMWPRASISSPYDIDNEPLYHNNSFFACRRPDFTYRDLQQLKELAHQTRHAISSPPRLDA